MLFFFLESFQIVLDFSDPQKELFYIYPVDPNLFSIC